MIRLTALTDTQLSQLDGALNVIDAALTMLLDVGAVDEEEGVDLVELGEAVGAELEVRGYEDAEYKVTQAAQVGECMAVQRPDGEIGYAPRN